MERIRLRRRGRIIWREYYNGNKTEKNWNKNRKKRGKKTYENEEEKRRGVSLLPGFKVLTAAKDPAMIML